MLADGIAERAGECCYAAVDGDRSAARRELFADPRGDVVVGQFLETDCPEGGGEVLGDVVAVAGHGRGLERVRLVLDPGAQVVGEGLTVVAVHAGAFAGQDAVQGAAGGGLGGKAAAAKGLASSVEAGQVDGEGPSAVAALREGGTGGAELSAGGVAAAAAAVDTTPVRVPAHVDLSVLPGSW